MLGRLKITRNIPKNLFSFMNFLFSTIVFSIMLETTFLNVLRSINHNKLFFLAKIEADRGVEYSKANSPNPSPLLIFPYASPLTSTCKSPSSKMKKQVALSFCFIKYSPCSTWHILNCSMSWSWSTLSVMSEEKVKWLARLLEMKERSSTFFFFSSILKFSHFSWSSKRTLMGQRRFCFLFLY